MCALYRYLVSLLFALPNPGFKWLFQKRIFLITCTPVTDLGVGKRGGVGGPKLGARITYMGIQTIMIWLFLWTHSSGYCVSPPLNYLHVQRIVTAHGSILCLHFNPLDARGASLLHPPDRPNKTVNSYIMQLYILLNWDSKTFSACSAI